jgi:hypothetical protein
VRTFTLTQWLEVVAEHVPQLRGVTAAELTEGEDPLEGWEDDAGNAADAWHLFHRLASLGRFSEEHTELARWVRSYDWKDSDEWHLVPQMLGLTFEAVLARFPPPWGNDGLSPLLSACNQLAAERGLPERFVSLTTHSDLYVIAAIPAAAGEALVREQAAEFAPLPLPPSQRPTAPPSRHSRASEASNGVSDLGNLQIPARATWVVLGVVGTLIVALIVRVVLWTR